MAITLVPTKLDLLTFDNESDNTELFFNDTHLVKNIFKIRRDVLFWNQVRVILQGRMFENKTSELMLVGINSTRFNNARRFDARDRKSEWLHAYFNIFLSILADIGKKLLVYKSIQNNLDTVFTPKLFGLDFHDALFNVKNEDSDYACAFSDCFTITNTNEEELRPTTTYSLDFIRKPGLKIDFCERFLEAEVDYFRKHIPLIVDKKPDGMEFCLRLEGYTP